jgi:DNA replication protein DnaC
MTSLPNNTPYDDEYYDDDGYIRCSTCHARRRTDEHLVIRCLCQRDEYEKQQLEVFRKKQEHIRRVNMISELREKSLLGQRYSNSTFENTEIVSEQFKNVFTRCRNYCNIADEVLRNGYGIYIFGNCGTGKTHLAACMCNELINQYQKCMFTDISNITRSIMATFNNFSNQDAATVIRQFIDVDFLVIDDIGVNNFKKDNGDNFTQDKLGEIINERYSLRKPTIFTSNYSPKQLIEERGVKEKTVDRIVEMSSVILQLEGSSYRHKGRGKTPF